MTGGLGLLDTGPTLPRADALDLLGMAADRRPSFGEYLGASLREGWWSSLAGQGAAQLDYRLGGSLPSGGEADRGDGDDGGPITREEYEGGPVGRKDLAWFEGLTRGEARRRTEAYDAVNLRRSVIDARRAGLAEGTAGFLASMAGAAASPESLLPFGPAFRAASGLRLGAAALRGAGAGARAGLLSTAAVSPLVLGSQALTFGDDVGFADLVLDLAVGTSLGAALGAAGGVAAAWRARDPRVAPSLDRQARAVDAIASAAADVAEGRPVDLSAHPVAAEQAALRAAYDSVRAQSQGPADDPLVRIEPGDIEASAISRGGWKGLGDVEVRGAGWGLVKFIWKHGEASPKPPGKQASPDDVLAFPVVIRTREPAVVGDQREWVVDRADGGRVVYVDSPVAGRDGRRVITIHVLDDPAAKEPSPPRRAAAPPGAAGPPGVPRSAFAGSPGDTAAPLFLSTGVDALPGDRPGRIPDSRSPEGPAPDNVGGPAAPGNGAPDAAETEAPRGTPGDARTGPAHEAGGGAAGSAAGAPAPEMGRTAAAGKRGPGGPPTDPSPGAPPPDPDAEARAELERADEDPLAEPDRDPDLALFEAQAAAGRLDPELVAAHRAAAAEAERLANVDKAYEAAALCLLGGGVARS